MTTTILVLAQSFPVLVTSTDTPPNAEPVASTQTVQPGHHDYAYISSTRSVTITEFPLPVQAATPTQAPAATPVAVAPVDADPAPVDADPAPPELTAADAAPLAPTA